IVILSNDLRIRRFTPMAERVLHLVPTDVSRPIGGIKPRIDVADLAEMAQEVIRTMEDRERDVQDHQGRWHSLRIRPYRPSDHKIDGAVLCFVDIHRLKTAVEQLRGAEEHASAVVEMTRRPLLVLDRLLRIERANSAFLTTFRTTPEQTLGRVIYQLGDG